MVVNTVDCNLIDIQMVGIVIQCPMNATEEFLIEALKEQGLLSEELLQNFLDEVESLDSTESLGDAGLDLINIASRTLVYPRMKYPHFLELS